MNCFGKLSRDDGQSRVPAPPHMMTGVMRLIISTREPTGHSTGRVRASRIPRKLPSVACRGGRSRLASERRGCFLTAGKPRQALRLLGVDGPATGTGAVRRGCDCPPLRFGDKGAPFGLAQKVLIANTVSASADAIFALPPDRFQVSS